MSATRPTHSAYAPPVFGSGITLDLSRNEGRQPAGAFAVPDDVRLSRYPDLAALRAALCAAFDAEPERVLVTAGGDDALLRVCLAWLGPGRSALCCVPTFEMIPRYVRLAGGRLGTVPWPDGPLPVDALLAAADPAPAVLFVVSPNNPTGAVATVDEVRRLAAALPETRLVLDLAYEEFANAPLREVAGELPNAIAVRTLSKAWSLAGLRVGAAVGPPQLLQELAAAGNPMPVSAASAAIAAQRIATGRDDVVDHVRTVQAQRQQLAQLVQELGGVPATPVEGNFVLVRGLDPVRTTASLASLGIAVRRFPDEPLLADAVRITLPGTDDGFLRLTQALRAVFRPAALLFDMDGVLADVSMSYRVAIVETARAFGADVTPEDVVAAKARGGCNDDWQLTRDLMAQKGVERPLAEVTERFEAIYQVLSAGETAMVDVPTLRRWRQRFRLGVVTGRPRADAERFLERFGMRELFDAVVCREDAPLKPDPAPVRLALRQLGVEAAWMLGDTVDDVRAAAGAAVLPVGVAAAHELPGSAFTLRSTPELDRLLP